MGLRERKAKKSRETIIAKAMELFSQNGYEATKMEAIAEAAELSPSTLYRYYPTKDSIVLASFMANSQKFAEVFADRVKEMPVERSLAEAIFAVLAIEDSNPKHALMVRNLLRESLNVRARLWDYLGEQQRQLSSQLAAAIGTTSDDPRAILTARIALEIVLASADIWRSGGGRVSSRRTAEGLMNLLRDGGIVFPDPGAPPAKKAPSKKSTRTTRLGKIRA